MDIDKMKGKALANKKANKKLFKRLFRMQDRVVDKHIHQAHDSAFECINCLECANCCKTTGPLYTPKDIQRISKYLKLKEQDFIDKYLRVDEDNDMVLLQTPCPFLGHDNKCSIYDVRPKACKEYPHTDRSRQKQLFSLTIKNSEICPAVNYIIDNLKIIS